MSETSEQLINPTAEAGERKSMEKPAEKAPVALTDEVVKQNGTPVKANDKDSASQNVGDKVAENNRNGDPVNSAAATPSKIETVALADDAAAATSEKKPADEKPVEEEPTAVKKAEEKKSDVSVDVKPVEKESKPKTAKTSEEKETVDKTPKIEKAKERAETATENDEEVKLVKRGLPSWMVQNAEDLDTAEETAEAKTAEPEPPNEAVRKPRGRQAAAAAQAGATPTARRVSRELQSLGAASSSAAANVEKEASGVSSRPRRSTRTRIDYVNPDAATVIAEVDDEELGGLSFPRAGRGRPVGSGRGRKRGAASGTPASRQKKRKQDDSSDEIEEDDDDAGSDYGSKKKTASANRAKTTAKPPRGRRGRPASPTKAKAKGAGRGRPPASGAGRKAKNAKTYAEESDDGEDEVVYDDHESDKDTKDEDEEMQVDKTESETAVNDPKIPVQKRARQNKKLEASAEAETAAVEQ